MQLKVELEEKLCKDGKLIKQRCSTTYLKKHNLYSKIENVYSDSDSISESLFRILNDIDERPKCKICGTPIKFNHGFATYCCQRCSNADPEVKKKNAAHVSKTLKNAYKERGEEIKAKRRLTNKERFGVDSCSLFKNSKIQTLSKETIKKKYGVENVLQLKVIELKT